MFVLNYPPHTILAPRVLQRRPLSAHCCLTCRRIRAESAGAPALVLPRALPHVRPCVVQSSALPPEGVACDPIKARATRDKEPEGGPAPAQPQGETPKGGETAQAGETHPPT